MPASRVAKRNARPDRSGSHASLSSIAEPSRRAGSLSDGPARSPSPRAARAPGAGMIVKIHSMPVVKLHRTVGVRVGAVQVGGGAPVVVQSMTMTDTADAAATAQQCIELAEAGSEMVRVTVNLPEAAEAVPEIKRRMLDAGVTAPLIGDFHYNGHLLLTRYPACAEALDKYRINPGNVGTGQAPRRAVRDDLQGRARPRQAGAHRRQRRLAQPGAGRREDAGEHRPRPRADLGRDHQRVHGAVGAAVDRARARMRAAQGPDHHLVQDVTTARSDRRLSRAVAQDGSAAAPRPDRGGHGHEGAGLVGRRDGRAAERRASATPSASR